MFVVVSKSDQYKIQGLSENSTGPQRTRSLFPFIRSQLKENKKETTDRAKELKNKRAKANAIAIDEEE